jgi:hypothetical protein
MGLIDSFTIEGEGLIVYSIIEGGIKDVFEGRMGLTLDETGGFN